jgi:hypothetical protein
MMQIAELKLFGSQSTTPGPSPAPLPEITLAVSSASVAEDGSTNLVYAFTRTGSTTSALSVNYSVGGTATLGTDYTGIGGTPATITFAAGSATATVTVDPTADAVVEADETVALTLTTGTGYTIGTTGAVVGTIANDDTSTTPPPTTPPSTPTALPRPTLITAVDLDGFSSSPLWEQVGNAFDNTVSTKYLNSGGPNAGIELSYGVPTQISSFVITTANDVPERDPASYQIYGFQSGSWQLLTSGALQLPAARLSDSTSIALPALPSLTQYRVIFPTLKGSGTMMQIAELKLFGSQSSLPASTFASTQSAIENVVGVSQDILIGFGQQGRVAEQSSALLTFTPQADGVIQEQSLLLRRDLSWPTHPIHPQDRRAFPVSLLSTPNRIPFAFMETSSEQHRLEHNPFPELLIPGNPFA